MDLKVEEYQLPAEIQFNFEEIKLEISEKLKKFENLVYTDDQVKDAKSDRASLNKLKKALQDEKTRRKKEYLKPFEDFESKINEIIKLIDAPVSLIDKQVKEFEEKKKADKRIEIGSFWETTEHPEWLTLAKLFDERWLNATYTMKQIQADINGWINRINSEIETLQQLEDFSFEAIETYKRSLDMNQAIAEGKRLADIQKRKEEEARRKAELLEAQKQAEEAKLQEMQKAGSELAEGFSEGLKEEQKFIQPEVDEEFEKKVFSEETAQSASMWINFSALLTVDQALKLKEFFNENNIQFKKI
ncbi:MAG: DUF1351 domain-containing protein [Mogibacterium sp.]|nr:DUF1351 domain-containing protein [Mogibacterium sp.]